MKTENGTSLTWNRSAVLVGAVMFLVAEVVMYGVFLNPRFLLTLVAVWFAVAFVVQFWGSRRDRIVAIVALAVMAITAYLLLVLGS